MKFNIDDLPNLTSEQLVKLIPHLKDFFNTGDLSRHSEIITKLLASLKMKHTYSFMANIDENFPGLSFHYIMEARHKKTQENLILLYRIAFSLEFLPEQKIFSPIRERLIKGLISDINDSDDEILNFKHNISKLSSSFSAIDSIDILSLKQKNKIKSSLFDKYITQLINIHFKTI